MSTEAKTRLVLASGTSHEIASDNTTHSSSDFNEPQSSSLAVDQQPREIMPEIKDNNNDYKSERKLLKPGHEIDNIGAKRGRVIVKRWLGSGAFADVYEVETNKVVVKHEAMKVITLKNQNNYSLSDAERIQRLRPHVIEAHLMIKLGHHANLVGV
eukprot:CAMPEP_0197327684 /NCGR_PEP_ID=MMETSP0892-20130614/3232_1 /TAXON_ID=44058 ORGANISM="Aureoumbra lagunensis, Strain CCMP1510" /NCGR_SAMPLE_ID=MMETSP0892 /ASSEMBLY_ACC=CAM_ASM_000538 /LENGTH=155 /DNA_ID=CAMNT_0042822725 /DNA_START=89 /DNA_END=552 /DNA_ORIENTATION=+